MAEHLIEFVDSRGSTLSVDRQKGVIGGVKVLGLKSANGRTYLKETVARAARLYEGVKVNLNHPKGSPNSPRDYQDRIGTIRNVSVEQGDGGLRGDFHFNPKHPLAEQLLWDAEHSPENVGFSHNVTATTARKDGRVVVEEIVHVVSVDLVADPATTRGLFEHTEPSEGKDTPVYEQITEAELRAKRPDLLNAIVEAALAEHANSESAKAKDSELASLKTEVAALKEAKAAADRKEAIDAELAEAKLPAAAVTELFRGQLLAAADSAARKSLIEDRRAIAVSGKPQSKEQQVAEGAGHQSDVTDGKSLARAISE